MACLVLLALLIVRLYNLSQLPTEFPVDQAEVTILRVIDGDTLLVDGERRVRLLGVNTPETKHPDKPPERFGEEASAFTRQRVEGKLATLVFDRERYDDYHRILAFVFVDGMFLNEELIRAGFSKAETQYSFKSDMKRRFLKAEEEAKAERQGIWSVEEIEAR